MKKIKVVFRLTLPADLCWLLDSKIQYSHARTKQTEEARKQRQPLLCLELNLLLSSSARKQRRMTQRSEEKGWYFNSLLPLVQTQKGEEKENSTYAVG